MRASHSSRVGVADDCASNDIRLSESSCRAGPRGARSGNRITTTSRHRYARQKREWDRWRLRGQTRQLAGSTVGVVGYGAIGRATAALVLSFGAKVLVYARRPLELPPSSRLQQCDSLEQLFDAASVVTLHVPLTAETRGMVGEDLLERLGPEGLLINTARGAIVNEGDLQRVLADGRLRFAALDVLATEPPASGTALLSLPNILVTPHVAGGGFDVLRQKAVFVAENLQHHQAGRPVEAQAI
ncbi:MAG: hypothetical protein KGI75_09780 [Rhizobiaceae bacterium]|nr:hypothetical protein [Rhizobiaceae bacterium]